MGDEIENGQKAKPEEMLSNEQRATRQESDNMVVNEPPVDKYLKKLLARLRTSLEKTPLTPEGSSEIKRTPQSVEMDSILQNLPLIEEIFNPNEEVQKLFSVPKEQRREAVSIFKDKLMRQREAWALCRTTIEERFEANPDIPREEMIGIIGQFASNYGFDQSHIKIAEQLIDDCISQHRVVMEIREKYPDNIALINRLTGMKFNSAEAKDFIVETGPLSIEILCSGINAARIHYKSKDPLEDYHTCGFATSTNGLKPIFYLVVNIDYVFENPVYYSGTLLHEREHHKNIILKPRLYGKAEPRADVRKRLDRGVLAFLRHHVRERFFGLERDFADEVLITYTFEKDPEKKAFLLGEYMRLYRENALDRVKEELIAMKKEPTPLRTQNNVFLEQDHGAYDYLAVIRDWVEKKNDPLLQETSRRILVYEYRDIIDQAILAFDHLVTKGYSNQEVIAMLSDKRLQDWPKTSKRILEAKNSRS